MNCEIQNASFPTIRLKNLNAMSDRDHLSLLVAYGHTYRIAYAHSYANIYNIYIVVKIWIIKIP